MSLCILAGGKITSLAVTAFTLAWTHSVEKTRWEEDWRVVPGGLELVTARIQGSGAGMEPPDGAHLVDGWWVYSPRLPVLPELALAASGANVGAWSLCGQGRCTIIGAPDGPVRLRPCGDVEQ